MKFPRNARIFRGQLDVAPFATVFFLLVIFMLLGSLVYTPGIRVELPIADDLAGTDAPTVSVAVDRNGGLFFENERVGDNDLTARLRQRVSEYPKPPVLIVQADKSVAYNEIIRVTLLARAAGISEAHLAVLPRPVERGLSTR
ncbi:MAG TPA: biopolymer transporter ExbD [Candidatus Dormibacteraeota bacterium]|nr:biopolymer transporter ExbD [Candidatus Dormibacteraeota bacterium]